MRRYNTVLHCGVALGAIMFLLPASAIAQSEPAQAAQTMNEPASAEPSQSALDEQATGDIIVTAQRTNSFASKTPIALSAISGDALRTANITNPTQLAQDVPNLAINRNNGGLQITIRGISSTDNTEKGDPSAAFLLDGIYIARPQVQEVSFYDVARVEVLRGPQGTLYGRNTTAGVVNVISNLPSDRFEASGNVSYGNYKALQGDAMINIPVNDMLAIRAAASIDRRDSYLTNAPGDSIDDAPFKNNISGRLQALFTPTSSLSLLLRTDYSFIRGNANYLNSVIGDRYYRIGAPGTDAFYNPTYIGNSSSTDQLLERGYQQYVDPWAHDNTFGISGELNWDFGPLKMTYIGSYRSFVRHEVSTLFSGVPARLDADAIYRQNSQELRFATTGTGPLTLQFGGYYFREHSIQNAYIQGLLPGVPYFGFLQGPTIAKSYAGFGQATLAITPTLRLTGGARYSHDDKSRLGYTVFQQALDYNEATDQRFQNSASTSSSKVTWRAGVDFDVDSRSLLYGVVSTGYKAGGFNDGCRAGSVTDGVPCNQPTVEAQLFYKPETLNAYEIGYKTRFAGSAVRLNASAFYYDYSNLQVSTQAIFNGASVLVTQNAAKADVKGVELEATLAPSRRNKLDLSFTYLDAHYKSYFPLGIGNAPDFADRPLDRSPKLVATASYTYTLPLAGGASIAANARTRLSDSYVVSSFSSGQQFRQPSATQSDASITYNAPSGSWYVQGFIRNIENQILVTAAANGGGGFLITPSDPRTFGGRLGFRM